MKRNKKGFTLVELVIVIAVIAILAGVMIAVFSGVIKRANENAELQQVKNDELKQKAEDVLTKLDNANWFSWEDFENSLATKLINAYKEYNVSSGTALTEAQVKNAVKNALDEYVASSATSNTSLTETQVKVIVENALANAKLGGVTEAQVRTIVNTAVGSINTVSKADIQRIVDAATSKGLTAEQVAKVINDAGLATSTQLENVSAKVNDAITAINALKPVTKKDVSDAIIDLVPVTYTINTAEDLADALARVKSFSTLNFTSEYTVPTGGVVITLPENDDRVLTIKGIELSKLKVNAPMATIYLVSDAGTVEVTAINNHSFHVVGKVNVKLTIESGRVVLEKGAEVKYLKAAPSENATVTVQLEEDSKITDTLEAEYQDHGYTIGNRDYIVIENNGDVEITNLTVTQALATSKTTTTNVKIVNGTNANGSEVETIKVDTAVPEVVVEVIDKETGKTVEGITDATTHKVVAFKGVAIIKNDETTVYMSLEDFRDSVNDGTDYAGKTVLLLTDLDLENVEWTPIGTSDHPFKGVFDGQGHTIENFKISSEHARGEDGLFGFVIGNTNMDAIDLSARWNTSTYSFDTRNVDALYTAVVKNLTVSGAVVSSAHAENKTDNDTYGDYGVKTNRKSTAAAIGLLRCAYAENIVVENSTINGYKTVGGVIGSLDGGSISNCKTTDSVKINGYSNIGGIVGGLETANDGWNSDKKSIISNCENNATINKITNDKAYGYVGGIIGTAQNDGSAVVACVVNGVIHSVNNGSDPVGGTYGAVGGVIGQSCSGGYFINLTNNATMVIEGAHGYVGGITEYAGTSILYNCVNNADITANAIQLAGIMAGALSGNTTYISCVNNGSLVNTSASSAVHDISSVNGVARIENQTFATVAELQAALNAQDLSHCTNVKLVNVTVTDTTGALSIPANVEAITSDKKVCSTVTLESGRTRGISVQLPGIDYTYDASNVIWFTMEGGSVTVPEGITVPSLSVKGANSVTIYGTVTGGVSVRDVATVNNNGTIGYINFTGVEDAVMTFNNNGAVGGVDGSAKHSVYTTGKVNLTVNNHGSIKAGEGNYALLFYGNSTVVFNAYAGSTITRASGMGALAINNGPSTHAKLVTFNVAEGADGVTANKYYGNSEYKSYSYDCSLVINFNAIMPE